MARGFPKSSKPGIAPLAVKRLKRVPLVALSAFQMENEKDNRKGETYTSVDKMLAFDWDSGYAQRDTDGELVLDEDGRAQPHLIHAGYVKLSPHFKSNFVGILKGMGFPDEYFDEEGSLREDIAETLEVEFGVNRLGEDFGGADWDQLPFYVLRSDGGEHDKRDIEVPILSLRLNGYEILGRVVDMILTTDKNGYNRADAYFPPEEFEDLDTPIEPVASMSLGGKTKPAPAKAAPAKAAPAKAAPARAAAAPARKAAGGTAVAAPPARKAAGMPKTNRGVPQDETEVAAIFGDSVDPENEPTPFDAAPVTKRAIYVTRALQTAGIPGKDRIEFLAWLLENENVTSIADISPDDAKHFRALAEANDDPGTWLRRQFIELHSQKRNPQLQQDEGDDDDGFDDVDEDEDF